MKIKLDTLNLSEILKNFYMLTGIRTVIFDSEYREIYAYPENTCGFCRTIRNQERLLNLCTASDIKAFERCKNLSEIYIYKCHAGLVEAALPIKDKDKIIGYIMLGQITDIKDKNELKKMCEDTCLKYNIPCDTSKIKYKNKNQILAASKLLEVCTDYMILKEVIGEEQSKKITAAEKYIKEHLSEQFTIYDISKHIGTSRTKLYEMFKSEHGEGIASFIRKTRLEYAKSLLKKTELSVSEISHKAGFSDYNYFSRIYKNKYGISPHKER